MRKAAFAVAVIACGVTGGADSALAGKHDPRSGLQPCRIAAQALIGFLDDGRQSDGDYAHAYRMVDSCGPARKAAKPIPVGDRSACRALALKMLDELDEGRLSGRVFVAARDDFAARCAPPPGVAPRAPS